MSASRLIAFLLLGLSVAACTADSGPKEVGGTAVGAVTGGLIGNAIGGSVGASDATSHLRLKGYRQELRAAGLPADGLYARTPDYKRASGAAASSPPGPPARTCSAGSGGGRKPSPPTTARST